MNLYLIKFFKMKKYGDKVYLYLLLFFLNIYYIKSDYSIFELNLLIYILLTLWLRLVQGPLHLNMEM